MVTKPWGCYIDLFRTPNLVIKKIRLNPGQATSLQSHEDRAEIWMAHLGIVTVTVNDHICELTPSSVSNIDSVRDGTSQSSAMLICTDDVHRAENKTEKPVSFWEVQFGECDEEDIVRLSDLYGRVTKGEN